MRRPKIYLLDILAFGLLVCAVTVYAQSRTERELMERIDRLEAAKRTADRERNALEEKALQAKRTATANRVVATKKVDAVVGAAIEESTAVTQEQVVIIDRAAKDAKSASDKADSAAGKLLAELKSQNIASYMTFAGIVALGLFAFVERTQTRKYLREDRAMAERTHKLVNSMHVALKKRELKLLRLNQTSQQLLSAHPDPMVVTNALATLVLLEDQIVDLEREIEELEKATRVAEDKIKADLAKIPGAVPA